MHRYFFYYHVQNTNAVGNFIISVPQKIMTYTEIVEVTRLIEEKERLPRGSVMINNLSYLGEVTE